MNIFNKDLKTYKKKMEFSYTFGAFPTYELIASEKIKVVKVIFHSSFTDVDNMSKVCNEKGIPIEVNDKIIERVRDKGNIYVVGIFEKYSQDLNNSHSHIVLVNPSNMGNLGTIIRTSLGFGIYDLAIIGQGADVFNPKTIRASMGALFKISFKYYENFDLYRKEHLSHDVFTFMLDEEKSIPLYLKPESSKFALVFGNEATGLDPSYKECGTPIYIPQSPYVDSLNLPIAAGIGIYEFTKNKGE